MTENITFYDLESDPILCELFSEELGQINTEEGMFGKCGDHLAWEIKKVDGTHGGVLKVFGFGLMWDYELTWDEERGTESESPWARFQPAKVFIGLGVMSIGENAFYGNPILKSVDVSEGVIYIGAHAFEECIFLKSVRLCAGLSVIGPHAFSHCKNLAEVTLSKDLKIIEENAFYDCGCLTSLIIPDQVKFIGEQAFGMDSLSSISDKHFVFEGDAPFISENAFDIYIDVIAFYNPEKTGWKEAVLRYFGARKIIWLKEGEEIPKKFLMCGDNLFWS